MSCIVVIANKQNPIPSDSIYEMKLYVIEATNNWRKTAIEYPNGFFQSKGTLKLFSMESKRGFRIFNTLIKKTTAKKSYHEGNGNSKASLPKSVVKYIKKLKIAFGSIRPGAAT